jgi:DNA helicase-2/ATP-dependent DNA helicase PcrA
MRLIAPPPAGPEPRFGEYDDEVIEATAVARRVRELIDGGQAASGIAVLYRVNAQSEVYEQALSDVDVPYLIRGGERFFARREVRQAIIALRAATDRLLGDDLVATVRAVLAPIGLTEQPPPGGAAKERWDALLALVELAEELVSTVDGVNLRGFVAELGQRAAAQHPPTVEGVTLASLHAAKGLEWDAVFLVGLAEGTMPIQHADGDEAAIEEERRLLYVGVTRAREHLWLSWALSRKPGGRRNRRRSRFLYGVVPEDHPAARVARAQNKPSGTKARCRVCGGPLRETMDIKLGRCGTCPSNVDEDLLERLRAWRIERSRELKVPAFVVFTDATLVAIAEQRPTDDGALVSISGIGASKLERFGAEVLGVVRASMSS